MCIYNVCVYLNVTLVAAILLYFEHRDQDPYKAVESSKFKTESWSPQHLARPVGSTYKGEDTATLMLCIQQRKSIWVCVQVLCLLPVPGIPGVIHCAERLGLLFSLN